VGDVLRQHCIVNGHHNSSFLAMGMLLEESKYQVLDLRTQLDQLKPNTLHLVPQLAGAVDSQAPVVHGSRRGSAHRGSSSTVAEGKGAIAPPNKANGKAKATVDGMPGCSTKNTMRRVPVTVEPDSSEDEGPDGSDNSASDSKYSLMPRHIAVSSTAHIDLNTLKDIPDAVVLLTARSRGSKVRNRQKATSFLMKWQSDAAAGTFEPWSANSRVPPASVAHLKARAPVTARLDSSEGEGGNGSDNSSSDSKYKLMPRHIAVSSTAHIDLNTLEHVSNAVVFLAARSRGANFRVRHKAISFLTKWQLDAAACAVATVEPLQAASTVPPASMEPVEARASTEPVEARASTESACEADTDEHDSACGEAESPTKQSEAASPTKQSEAASPTKQSSVDEGEGCNPEELMQSSIDTIRKCATLDDPLR
jgi:hypothetical protein